jgi:hypothetical protein
VTLRPGDEIALGGTSFVLVDPLAQAGRDADPATPPCRARAWPALAVAGGLLALCAAALALAAA